MQNTHKLSNVERRRMRENIKTLSYILERNQDRLPKGYKQRNFSGKTFRTMMSYLDKLKD